MPIFDKNISKKNRALEPNKFRENKTWEYKWARECFQEGIGNTWVPQEVRMKEDKEQWDDKDKLTKEEKKLILLNLGFFSTAETLTANNLALCVLAHIKNLEISHYLGRQFWEEIIHAETFIYCCESLNIKEQEIFDMHENVPSIKAKDDFVRSFAKKISKPDFKVETNKDKENFLFDLIAYYIVMEGIFFYAGFAMMLALRDAGKMIGIGKQFEFILRDESIHLKFGCKLINEIKKENPEIWNNKIFQQKVIKIIKKAVELEEKYVKDVCPRGVLHFTSEEFISYVRYIANRRLVAIGLKEEYNINKVPIKNPFDWMSRVTDLNRKANFFEAKVSEYKTAIWNDEEEDDEPINK